jgi:hypothetical protein
VGLPVAVDGGQGSRGRGRGWRWPSEASPPWPGRCGGPGPASRAPSRPRGPRTPRRPCWPGRGRRRAAHLPDGTFPGHPLRCRRPAPAARAGTRREHPLRLRAVQEAAHGTEGQPRRRPAAMFGDLASDVVVGPAGSLDDRVALRAAHLENDGIDESPAVVGDDLEVPEPRPQQLLLDRGQRGGAGHRQQPWQSGPSAMSTKTADHCAGPATHPHEVGGSPRRRVKRPQRPRS